MWGCVCVGTSIGAVWAGPTHAASLWHRCGRCAHLSIQVSFSLQVCSWHCLHGGDVCCGFSGGCSSCVLQITHPDHFTLRLYSLSILASWSWLG